MNSHTDKLDRKRDAVKKTTDHGERVQLRRIFTDDRKEICKYNYPGDVAPIESDDRFGTQLP